MLFRLVGLIVLCFLSGVPSVARAGIVCTYTPGYATADDDGWTVHAGSYQCEYVSDGGSGGNSSSGGGGGSTSVPPVASPVADKEVPGAGGDCQTNPVTKAPVVISLGRKVKQERDFSTFSMADAWLVHGRAQRTGGRGGGRRHGNFMKEARA